MIMVDAIWLAREFAQLSRFSIRLFNRQIVRISGEVIVIFVGKHSGIWSYLRDFVGDHSVSTNSDKNQLNRIR